MLASETKLEEIKYPVLCTPKLDGVRALVVDGKLVSRNFKPIRNIYTRTFVEQQCPNGFDGELIVDNGSFQATTSGVMSEDGQPNFVYNVFDYVKKDLNEPYEARMRNLKMHVTSIGSGMIKAILPVVINNEEEFLAYEKKCLDEGYEGVMIRSAQGPYKLGRSTVREGFLLKFKRFADAEAIVIGFEEKLHNSNEATKDAFGHTTRSGHQANLIPMNTLGSLVVKGTGKVFKDIEFNIPGFNDLQRKEIWNNRKKYLGQLVKYKYQPTGVLDKPRFPIFLGWRDKADMGGN